MRKEEENVRTKVSKQLLNVILLTNKLQHIQRVGTHLIGHFQVPLCLCFKTSLSVKPFI